MDAPYAMLEQLEPGDRAAARANPSPFTFTGTQSYFVGEDEVVVIDPGPDLPEHVEAHRRGARRAAAGRRSPAPTPTATIARRAGRLPPRPGRRSSAARRSASTASGRAPMPASTATMRPTACWRRRGDRVDGERADRGGDAGAHVEPSVLRAIAAPCSPATMSWAGRPRVVVPPDGDMGDYMASLDKLRGRDDRIYYPAHGPAVTKPQQLVRGMIGHRMQRERQILKRLAEGDRDRRRDRRRGLSRARSAAGAGGGRIGHRAFAGP